MASGEGVAAGPAAGGASPGGAAAGGMPAWGAPPGAPGAGSAGAPAPAPPVPASSTGDPVEAQLRDLERRHKAGEMDGDEYQRQRRAVLDQAFGPPR
jgi:hypothetical protein